MPTDRISGFSMGVSVKVACQVATTGENITLSGVQTIDGISVGSGSERILVKDQTGSTYNGIYVADSSSWLRAKDCDGNKDILPGSLVYVDRGAVNQRSFWVFNSSSTATSIVVGTDGITADDVTSALGFTSPSAWTETNIFPLVSAASARSVVGAFPTTSISSYIEVNLLSVTSASAVRSLFQLNNTVDVTWYGAVASSTADSSTAIQAALVAAKNKELFIPSGTYWLTKALSSTYGGITVSGAGKEVTELRWFSSSTSEGMILTASSNCKDFIAVRDLALTTPHSSYTGLTISASRQIIDVGGGNLNTMDRVHDRSIVERCTFAGADLFDGGNSTTTGWLYGVELVAQVGSAIKDCSFLGKAYNSVRASTSSIGIYLRGEPQGSTENGHPVQIVTNNNTVWFYEIGLYSEFTEGVYITNSNYVACTYGAWGVGAGWPQFNVNNTHMNCETAAVNIAGMVDCNINNNLFYGIQTSTGMVGVQLDSSAYAAQICGNTFVTVSTITQTMTPIAIEGHHCVVSNNIFRGSSHFAYAISLSAGSYNVRGGNNVYYGTPAAGFIFGASNSTTHTVTVSSST